MPNPITITGIAPDMALPLTAVEIRFGTGPAGGSGGQYRALLIGCKTSAGSATTDTVVYGPSSNPPLQTESDVIALFGAGSEAHRMYRRFVAVNNSTQVNIIAPAEGGSATPSTIVITLLGTATAQITHRLFVMDELIDVNVPVGSLPATIAAAAVSKINGQAHWPVTAAVSGDTYVITSKNAGPRANEIRVRAMMLGSGGMTCSGAATSTALSGGAVTDDWTTLNATIAPMRFYYIASPSTDITAHTFDDLLAQVASQALPANGLRQVVVAGAVGTQNAGSTTAASSAVNTVRAKIIWQEESDWGTAAELAAQYLAARALFDTTRTPKYNFDGFGATDATRPFWKVTPQSQQSKRPTPGATGSLAAAINNGLTPIATTQDGSGTYVVMDVTTKHKNGANYDYKNRDGIITTVCDFFADECVGILDSMRSGKNLVDDPLPGTIISDRDSVFPRLIKSQVGRLVQDYADAGQFKHAPTILASMRFQVSPVNQSRSEGYVQVQVVNLHHQAVMLVEEASTLTS